LKTTFFLLLLNKRRKSRDLDAMSLSANFMGWSSSVASTVSRQRGDILDMKMPLILKCFIRTAKYGTQSFLQKSDAKKYATSL
jgi:hypothetical protein